MDSTTLSAVITGSAAIGGPLITFAVTRMYDHRNLANVGGPRRQAIGGIWTGTSSQTHEGKDVHVDVQFKIEAGKKLIEGEGHFRGGLTGRVTHIKLTGGFLHDQFARLDYVNLDPHTVQFGTVILCLSPDARKFEGSFVGFGAETRKIVTGNVVLVKST